LTPLGTINEQRLSEEMKGPTDLVSCKICLKDRCPIKQRYRSSNPTIQAITHEHVDNILQEEELFSNRWSSSIVLARKKDESTFFCIDYRCLNTVTEKNTYSLPRVNATLYNLRGAKYLSTIDLKS
jgi:hypothetical protein